MLLSADAPVEMPGGADAGAYYHKSGYGFQQLLEAVSGLARKAPLRTARPHVDNKPVQARRVGDGQYIIDCEDCLREFSVLRAFHLGRDEKWATCVHCGKLVQYLDAEHYESW
jgi:predicted SprT family Zn-dependent metalloprotease